MSHAYRFDVSLTCLCCGAETGGGSGLHTSGLNPEAIDAHVRPGDVLPIFLGDFEDAYDTVRTPGDADEVVSALEWWSCPVCRTLQWARLEFRREDPDHYRFLSARTVELTPDTVRAVNFATPELASWIQRNPGAEADRLREALEGTPA